jgi:hypothetical protein
VTKSNLVDTVPGDVLLRRAYIEPFSEHGCWLSHIQVNESKREISNPSKDQADISEWQFLQLQEFGTSMKAELLSVANKSIMKSADPCRVRSRRKLRNSYSMKNQIWNCIIFPSKL